jgi:putative methionine-R-sulfoxide reductase with GAF domain
VASRVGTYTDVEMLMLITMYIGEITISHIEMGASLCNQYAKKGEVI